MQVSKWGNSLAVRLPAAVVEALKLKEGDEIEIRIAGEREFEVRRDQRNNNALARLRMLRRPLPAGFVFAREETNAREGARIGRAKRPGRRADPPEAGWPRRSIRGAEDALKRSALHLGMKRKAPAADPSATLRASGGRYNGGKEPRANRLRRRSLQRQERPT